MNRRDRNATWALIALCSLLPALAGCGGPGERGEKVSVAASAFERALDGADRAALCAALAPETRREVEDSEKKACLDAIGAQHRVREFEQRVRTFGQTGVELTPEA
ncbi:hypothetical protein ABZY45_24350 [Streptomyces sp. NPDC006516]|uniref:hypothetical protein n=1 Tax=Streptomyces sp. NPDC006516 TaxID=3154309 RepID=UPI0033A7512E